MAEDDKNAGAWSRVPVWDGDPKTWRSFRKEMTWWLEALDVQSTKKYNLAARWLLRQSGIVRQRGEEFTPAELAFQPAIMAKDPETGDDIELTPEDPLAQAAKSLGDHQRQDTARQARRSQELLLLGVDAEAPREDFRVLHPLSLGRRRTSHGRSHPSHCRAWMVSQAKAWFGCPEAAVARDRIAGQGIL